jgi:hypothetical protein
VKPAKISKMGRYPGGAGCSICSPCSACPLACILCLCGIQEYLSLCGSSGRVGYLYRKTYAVVRNSALRQARSDR